MLLACLVIVVLPIAGQAACTEKRSVMYLPAPEGSQTDMLYLPLLYAWPEDGAYQISVKRAPGRGGSYALSRLLLDDLTECSLAAIQIPSLHFLTRAPNRMVRESEITPIAVFAYAPYALWVDENSPVRSLQELQTLAREAENQPDNHLIIAGVGSYTDQHLANLMLDRVFGAKSVYYPLTGTGEAAQLLKGNKVQACWGYALPAESMPGMRPLAVASEARIPALPQTPTFREQGFDLAGGSHFGVAMTATTPESTKKALSDRIMLLMANPSLHKLYNGRGASPLALGYEDMPEFMSLRTREANESLEEYSLIPRFSRGE